MRAQTRILKELRDLECDPPPGIAAWPSDDDRLDAIEATIEGVDDTPYAGGVFRLSIQLPAAYPLEPPSAKFETPVYHPNVDAGGRICLDTLKMPPNGAWKPSLSVATVLCSIQQLLTYPNPDDPLDADIANEFRHQHEQFVATAKAWTKKHAIAAARATLEKAGATAAASSSGARDTENRSQQEQQPEQQQQHIAAVTADEKQVDSGKKRTLAAAFDDDESGDD